MSLEFYRATQKDLANPGPDSMAPIGIYLYYVAMMTMNTLNYYWFANMVRLALFGSKEVHKAERAEHQD